MSKVKKVVSWDDVAYDSLVLYIGTQAKRTVFMAENARTYAENLGIPTPNDKRSWGKVIRRAVKNGLIIKAGYGSTSNPLAHGTPATLWRKA
jgi:hypothetical protein